MRRILVTGEGYTNGHFESLSALGFEIVRYIEIGPDTLLSLLPTIDAHILGGSERLNAEAIRAAVRLRLISFVGTGYGDFIDEDAARGRDIMIANTPGVMATAVAEHTIGLLLGLVRRLFAQNEAVKRSLIPEQPTKGLANTVIGIVGMGAVGTCLARILTNAFGCTLSYTSRSRKPHLEYQLGLKFLDIDTLFADSEAIVLLVPTTPATTNLVDAARLRKSRHGLLLVNTASPRLVEAAALRHALQTGQVAAAAFDGYWIEPLPKPSLDPFGLLALPDSRFVVTPHMAAKTSGTWQAMIDLAVNNVIHAFEPT